MVSNLFIVIFFLMIRKLIYASLQTKGSCFLKLFNFEKILSSIITCKLVLGSLAMGPLLSHDIYHKLL